MADPNEMANRPEDPFVRSRAATDGGRTISLAGLFGDSDRTGCRRLYLTTALDYFVEFRTDEVVTVEDVAADQHPFPGLDATLVTLSADATLDWVRRARGADPFLLEASEPVTLPAEVTDLAHTWEANCPGVTVRFGDSDFQPCRGGGGTRGGVFGGWPTQGGRTCATCDQGTCVTCEGGTCATCWGGTCATCNRETCATCDQGTCVTCGRFTCDPGCQATAGTCVSCAGTCDQTCASCWNTCEGTCVSCRGTCDATCANTCAETCANTCWSTCWATCDTCNTCQFQTCGCPISDPAWCIVRS